MLHQISQTSSRYSLFYLSLLSFVTFFSLQQNIFAAEITSEQTTGFTYSADNEELLIGSGGHYNLTGTLGTFVDGGGVEVLSPSEIAATLDGGLVGAILTIDTGLATTGIDIDNTRKEGPAVHSKLGSSFQRIELKSGLLNSRDTGIFLTDSDAAGTDIIVHEGAEIQGSRFAIRQDHDYEVAQVDDGKVENEGTSSETVGTLNLRVSNAGTIASNSRLVTQPFSTVTNGAAFYFGGRNRVSTNASIVNEATGKIYGRMYFGTDGFDSDYKTKNYIESEYVITNRGLISTQYIVSDFKSKLTITNEANGEIRLEQLPDAIASSGGDGDNTCYSGSEECYDVFVDPTFDFVEDADWELTDDGTGDGVPYVDPRYVPLPVQSIRLQHEDSSLTNYGDITGKIIANRSTQEINLYGGNYNGTLLASGIVTLGDDLSQNALTGEITFAAGKLTGLNKGRLNIGSGTYNLASSDTYNDNVADFTMAVSDASVDSPTISTTFTDEGAFSRLNVEGAVVIDGGAKLNINTQQNYSYLTSGVEYVLIDGNSDAIDGSVLDSDTTTSSGSDVKAIADGNITINDVANSNGTGILRYSTAVRDLDYDDATDDSLDTYHDLIVIVTRLDASEFTDDEEATDVFEVVDEIASDATGALKDLQKYIDTTSSFTDVENALKSAAPINNGDIELATMVPIHEFLQATDARADRFINERIQRRRFAIVETKDLEAAKNEEIGVIAPKKEEADLNNKAAKVIKVKKWKYALCNPTGDYREEAKSPKLEELRRYCLEKMREEERIKHEGVEKLILEEKTQAVIKEEPITGISFGDKLHYPRAGWGKVYGSSSQRDGRTAFSSFNSKTSGFAMGRDWQLDKSVLFGVALSYAQSDISSQNSLKNTTLDTYQLSVYGSKLYDDNKFMNASLGVAWTSYDSSRVISAASVTANANYEGQSYIGKIRGGKVYDNYKETNFDIIPELSATIVNSTFNAYEETGANTLNLNVEAGADRFLEGRIGFNVHYNKRHQQDANNDKILTKYRYHNSYGHNFLNKKRKTTANFVGQTESFTTTSDADGSGSLRLGLGMDVTNKKFTVISLDLTADFMKNYMAHSGALKYKREF